MTLALPAATTTKIKMQFARMILLLVVVRAAQTEDLAAESVVERPPEGAPGEAQQGVEATAGEGRSPRLVTGAAARQGVVVPGGGTDMFSMTLNALNPVPYLLGGLNGVRQVMQQRFYPIHGMLMRHPPRPAKFRGGPRFIPNSGGKHVGGGDGGGRHVVGGSSGGRHAGGSFNSGGNGGGNFRGIRGREKPFHPDFRNGGGDASISNSFKGGVETRPFDSSSNFDTPKPNTIVGKGKPEPALSIDNTNSFPSLSTGTFSDSGEASSPNALHSSEPGNTFTRVINIQVPKEMKNMTIVEISMKANGDVTVGKESNKDVSLVSSGPPPPPSFSSSPLNTDDIFASLPPGVGDIFAEDQRLHRFNLETNLHDSGFHTNPEGLIREEADFQDFLSSKPFSLDSIQDILRMQSVGNTNSAFGYRIPYDWNSLNNLKPNVLSSDPFNANEYRPVQLPQSFPRNSPVPHFPANFVPEKKKNIYYVPLSLSPSRSNRFSAGQIGSVLTRQRQRSQAGAEVSPVYYIDITIPGNRGGAPLVNTGRFTRRKRSLQYDGWYPMDVSNPMADDPTVGYQPPPLERVHFSNEPMPKKPMYPVRPENPPVFVVRSEPRQPEYHSVYGTENVEYFHIHPQTNTVRAFRAPSHSVGAFRFVPAPQFDTQQPSSSSKPYTETLENTSQNVEAYAHLLRGFDYLDIPEKEAGFSDKSDNFDGRPAGGNIRFPEDTSYYDDYDMEGAFSEIRPTTVARPTHVFPFSRGDRNSGSSRRTSIPSHRRRPDPPSRRSDTLPTRDQEPKPSRPALHELLGNFPQESQIEEAPYLGSATDGASFVREIPPPNFRYSSRRTNKQQPTESPRSPPRGGAVERPAGKRPWFLIDTRTSQRKREPSIASYIQPETHSGDEKIHYRPFGPVSYVSKAGGKASGGHIHNPHLDDHMNSYKPTLTANSLSELLQIFRFTQVTDRPGDKDITDEPVTLLREFRYTRPTEAPPTTFPPPAEPTVNRTTLSVSYRYTPSPSNLSEPTTEPGVTKNPGKRHFDAVADTNSLDGYLFSDSEANPEYAHPQVRPNVVVIKHKDAEISKGVVRESSRVSVSSSSNANIFRGSDRPDTFEELEIIYPGPPPKGTTAASWPLYIIHQGHSKVKVFGINSAEDKGLGNSGFTDIYVFPPTEPTSTTATTGTASLTAASAPTSTTISSSSSIRTINTTLSSSTTTTSSSRKSTTLHVTHSAIAPTTPFPVDENDTIPSTNATPATIPSTDATPATIPSTDPVTDFSPAPTEATDEFEYHDTEFDVPDQAFGEDYHPEGWERPSLRLPGPPLAPSPTLTSLAHPTPPPPTEVPDALGREDLSVTGPEVLTERLGTTTEEAQTSPPSEDLSQLRHLETDRSPAAKDSPEKPVPQPRMERVAEVAAEA